MPGLSRVVGVAVASVVLVLVLVTLIGGRAEKAAADAVFTREVNIDRSGDDLRKDVLPEGASVEECERICAGLAGCVAYTFVKRSSTVPQPICWLKASLPHGHASNCCISGVRQR